MKKQLSNLAVGKPWEASPTLCRGRWLSLAGLAPEASVTNGAHEVEAVAAAGHGRVNFAQKNS